MDSPACISNLISINCFISLATSEGATSILISILSGVVGSFLYWYLVLRIKPNIKVGQVIVHNSDEDRLEFKIENKGRSQVIDLQVQLELLWLEKSASGFRSSSTDVEIISSGHSILGGRGNSRKLYALSSTSRYFVYDATHWIKIVNESSDSVCRFMLLISATHELSNTKLVERIVFRPEDIKSGRWGAGLTYIPLESKSHSL